MSWAVEAGGGVIRVILQKNVGVVYSETQICDVIPPSPRVHVVNKNRLIIPWIAFTHLLV